MSKSGSGSRRDRAIAVLVAMVATVGCVGIAVPLVALLFLAVGLSNAPVAETPPFAFADSYLSTLVLSHRMVVRLVTGSKAPVFQRARVRALERGDWQVIGAGDGDAGPRPTPNTFRIYAITPRSFNGRSRSASLRLVERFTAEAIRLKSDVVVDASIADAVRTTPRGAETARKLREANVKRLVIVDGAHHVGSLPLHPDGALVPVFKFGERKYVSHWYERDAMPLATVLGLMKQEGIPAFTYSGWGIPVKNAAGMGWLAWQAVLAGTGSAETVGDHAPVAVSNASEYPVVATSRAMLSAGGELFMSLHMGNDGPEGRAMILKKVEDKVSRLRPHGRDVRRLDLGLTYGTSFFPAFHRIDRVQTRGVEEYLEKHLKYDVRVIGEPASTWDLIVSSLMSRPPRGGPTLFSKAVTGRR